MKIYHRIDHVRMFGVTKLKEPLYKILRRYQVIYVGVTLFFMWLGFSAWQWFKVNYSTMNEAAAAGFVSIFIAIIGALKYVLENSRREPHDH